MLLRFNLICWACSCLIVGCVATTAAAQSPESEKSSWKPLFDGESLEGWKVTKFGGEGEVHVEEGAIALEMGASLTGITWKGEVPKTNYEIRLEAQRADGFDFFCGLTFPVQDSYCSFIVGGWGGAVVGLSSINDEDASRNDTTKYMKFERGKWYPMRVRVTPSHIQCWIDGEQVVNQDIRGKKISTRNEVLLSRPLGFSAWETRALLRKIELRKLENDSAEPAGK